RRQVGSERDQRLIAAALESAERAKTLVQRLLAFARRQPLQTGAIDIAGLLEGMSELVSSTVGPQIRLVVDAEPNLAPARSDANQLEMAILNLAVNARDAMPDGGMLTIRAALEQVGAGHASSLAAGAYVRLTIADTGVGMDEATLAKAVEPFFSTKGVGKGTGLGLSMVHGLMSQLGGAMQISSARGHGTTIALFLPVAAESGGGEAVGSVQAGSAEARAGTVLLVDDADLVRASTAEVLRDLGYSVVEAASAKEAMDHLANNAVDYVVTDHLMPEVSGLELARTIASRADAPPVLVVSGYADLDEISADFPRLAKPFRQDELASALASLRRG
ncbi:MAG: ATP-binding protein, partial [Sphingomonadales bacterium]